MFLANITFRLLFLLQAVFLITLPQVAWGQFSAPSYVAEADKTAKPTPEAQGKAGQAPLSVSPNTVDWATIRVLRLSAMSVSEQQRGKDQKKFRVGSVRTLPQMIESLSEFTKVSVKEGTLYLLRIASPQATALRLHLKLLALPEGGRIFVFSRQNPQVFSPPYTGNKKEIWTPSLPGEELVIECFIPAAVTLEKDLSPFQIDAVSHIYRHPRSLQNQVENAANCNEEVPADFVEAGRATALITFVKTDGEYACSGTLLSDIKKTGTPYFLTANHCISNNTEAGSAEVYWRYDAGPEPTIAPTRGAQVIVADEVDDYALLQLSAKPPSGVVYSGWSTTSRPVGTAVTGIHHPQADYKRASFGKIVDATCPSEVPPGFCDYYLKVRWDRGITEPGSSGSGLFIGTGSQTQLIGLLSGGESSCENQAGVDWYPRFSRMFGAFGYYLTNGEICRYALTEKNFSYSNKGGQGSFTIVPKIGGDSCPWQAQTDFSWVTLTSANSGTSLGEVTFQVAPNTSDQPRLAVISMPQIGRNAVIYQAGKPPEAPCAPVKVEFNQQISGNLSTSPCKSMFDSSLPALRYSFDAEAGRLITINTHGRVYLGIFSLIYPNGKILRIEDTTQIIVPDTGNYVIEYAQLPTEYPQPGVFNFTLTQGCRYEFALTRFELDAWGLPLNREKVFFPVKVTASGNSCARLYGAGDEWDVDNWLSGTHNQILNELHFSGYYNNIANTKQRYTVVRYYQQPFIVKQYAKCTGISNLTFSPNQVNLAAIGGQQQIMVKQAGGLTCSWGLSPYRVYSDGTLSSTSLIQIIRNDFYENTGYGTGDRTISYTVPANTEFTERKYALKMEDQVIQNITQAPIGSDCNRQSIQMGQTIDGTLSANDCAWAIAGERVDFYQFNAVAGEQVAIELSATLSTEITAELAGDAGWYWSIYDYERKGTARYPQTGYAEFPATGTYTLRVHGKPGTYQLKMLNVGPAGCTYNLDKQGETFLPSSTTSFTANLTCNRADCDWSVQSSANWITVPGGATGKGSQAIPLAFAPNTGAKRQATVTIAGRTFKIIQDAPCSYAKVNTGYPDKIHTSPQGGEYRFQIDTGSNCPVSITSESNWITVASTSPQVTLTTAANPGGLRKGAVTIAGQKFEVVQGGNEIVVTTAADYQRTVAPGSLVTAFYAELTNRSAAASSLPLPQSLADIGVQINYPISGFRTASLLYVSPTQVNFYLPEDAPAGTMKIQIYNYASASGFLNPALFATGEFQVEKIAPSVFSADSSGKGVAAADIQRVRAGQPDIYEPIAEVRVDEQGKPVFIARPIRIGEEGEQTFLLLYATGVRMRTPNAPVSVQIGDVTLPVQYAGPQGAFIGLDQINILLPASLRGKGLVNVTLTIEGKTTNLVQINLAP
jgi:uncharacterized protein (TIGR03437 family)